MVNNNNLINKKPIELVQEIEKYEIKKSPLSLDARNKVINKSGSCYVSENKESYGPGSNQSGYSDDSEKARVERQYGKATLSAISSLAPPPVQMVTGGLIGQQVEGFCNVIQGPLRPDSLLSQLLKEGKTLHEIYELRGGWDRLHLGFHQFHRMQGEEYNSDCDVCKG